MLARYVGAGLGLLAFSVSVVAGLVVQNPPIVTLSRSILALFVFCFLGLVLGYAAQLVVREHEKGREAEIRRRLEVQAAAAAGGGAGGETRAAVRA
ncbi:MAG: hypothetical protein HY763_05875 [Planctomycetes bacterium]|nr:hypothetical protein [Planctomycetota bacterium]